MYLFLSTFMHLYDMDVKEFLLSTDQVTLSGIANRMYPDNKTAENYLYKKLHGKSNRRFTKKDALLAQDSLRTLGYTLISLTVADEYP